MGTLLKDMKFAVRGLLKRPGSDGDRHADARARARRQRRHLQHDRRPRAASVPAARTSIAWCCWRKPDRASNTAKESVSPANFLDWREHAGTIRSLSAMQWWDANLVDAQDPERLQGYIVSVGLLRRPRHPAGARPRLRARRRDVRPPSRRRRQRRPVEAALRRRPGDRRPQHHDRRRAVPGRRRGAAAVRLSRRRADLGAARVRSDASAPARRPIPHGHRQAGSRPARRLEDAQAEMTLLADAPGARVSPTPTAITASGSTR